MNTRITVPLKTIALYALMPLALGLFMGAKLGVAEQTIQDYGREFNLVLGQLHECESKLWTAEWDLGEARETKDWTATVTADQFSQALNGSWICEEEPTCQAPPRPELDDILLMLASIGWEQASDAWAESDWALDRCERELETRR